jgi:hypothetical protein
MSFADEELPARARALLDAARDCDDPTPQDHARISAALAPRLAALGIVPALLAPAPLAAAPAVTSAAAASAGAGGLGLGAKLAIVLVGASVAAGGTMYAVQPREPAHAPAHAALHATNAAHPKPERAASSAPVMQPAPAVLEQPAIDATAVDPTAAPAPRALDAQSPRPLRAPFTARRVPPAAVAAGPDTAPPEAAPVGAPIDPSLREELAIIARANTALRLEHAADALRALDEHARRFENGVLSEERRGLRVLALCALAPNQAALDARAAFLRSTPNALLAPKVRAACSNDSKEVN